MLSILKLSLSDFFTRKFLNFALLPLFFSFVLFCVLAYFGFSFLLEFFDSLFGKDPQTSHLAWFYSLAVVQIIIGFLSVLSASFIIVFASVFFAIFIVSFLTPFICKALNDKYYRQTRQNSVSTHKVILATLWILVKFLLFFCLATIALIVPFVNVFVYYIVIYYLFHKLLLLDVASNVLSNDDFAAFYSRTSPLEFKFSTLCFYLLASVPFVGLFLQVFYVIFLSHLFYQKVLKISPSLAKSA